MTTDKRDIQGLTYFARRLRDATYGCAQWDEAGTHKVFTDELLGQDLRTALERVVAHACDPEAKTPGAIKRPFEPKAETSAPKRDPYDPRAVCHVCGLGRMPHTSQTGHDFLSVEAARAIPSTPPPDHLRAAIAPTRTWDKTEENADA